MTTRREFLCSAGGCMAYMASAAPFLPTSAIRRWSQPGRGKVVAQEPFARIEEIGEGLWAIISTPLGGDFTTICNGGIIAGSNGTAVVEVFGSPEGGTWAASLARELTGRWPTHAIVSHYHGDHVAGAPGFAADGQSTTLHATEATRDQVVEGAADDPPRRAAWADVTVLPDSGPSTLDLGDRTLQIVSRRGHTASDVTVEVDEGAGPIWCGDLVWNSMFPNYMDAVPSRLSNAVRALAAAPSSTYVPGHGPMADQAAMTTYLAVIDSVEEAAREAHRRGIRADEAAENFQTPESLGEWTLFNPGYYQRAIQSWLDELG